MKVEDIGPADAIARCKALADIERGFRVLKSDIEIAPVHHWLNDRIRAQALIRFLALVHYRVMRMRPKAVGRVSLVDNGRWRIVENGSPEYDLADFESAMRFWTARRRKNAMEYTRSIKRDGRKRLKKLLPAAMREAKKRLADGSFEAQQSLMADVMIRHAKPDNLDGVMVYRTERGWYADLVMREVPLGASNVMGTPADMPRMSREEAEKEGYQVLVAALFGWMRSEEDTKPSTQGDVRVFKLHGRDFAIPGSVVDSARAGLEARGDVNEDDADEIRAHLVASLVDIMGGDRFDDDLWKTADDEARMKVVADMTMLLSVGHFFHPDKDFPDPIDEMRIN